MNPKDDAEKLLHEMAETKKVQDDCHRFVEWVVPQINCTYQEAVNMYWFTEIARQRMMNLSLMAEIEELYNWNLNNRKQ
jgi:hypothetical protein